MMKSIGVGAIAYDTKPNEHMAEIVIYDLVNGEEEFQKEKGEAKVTVDSMKDTVGNVLFSSAELSNTITARWSNGGSNRISMPAFSQGEQVEVFQMGDTDRYYFKAFHLEKDLRRKEPAVFSFSNKDKEKNFGESFEKDSSYTLTVDPENKLIELKTSISDGEPVLYTIALDTKAATLTIEDDQKNKIHLDSLKKELTFTVPNIKLIGETLDIKASKSIVIDSPDITIGSGKVKMNSSVKFSKACDHKANVKFNGQSKTKIGLGKKPHIHVLE